MRVDLCLLYFRAGWASLPVELRERCFACVEEGHSHRSSTAQFRGSVKAVNDMGILKPETDELEPRTRGNGGGLRKRGRLQARPDLLLAIPEGIT